MSTLPNKRKRRLKTDSFDNPEKISESSSTNHEDLPRNKWKRRLHSLRRGLSKKKLTNLKEFQVEQDVIQELSLDNKEPALADITIDNRCENIKLNGLCQQSIDEKHSPYVNGNASTDPYISDSSKTNVMKRKGFQRRTKENSVRSNRYSGSQQDLNNGKFLEKQDSEIKQSRNGRRKKSLFSSWFKLPRKSTSEKNLKRQGLSVSTGNFNEENNFKLLTDVRLVRDPGYISSSGESIDLGVGKYNSLRRSRASLIDIKWHKHAKSVGNLVSPTSRNRTLGPLSPIQKSTKQEVLLSGKITPSTARNRASVRRHENRYSSPVKIDIPSSACENWEAPERSNSLGSFGNTTEDDDVYLTAEEDSRKSSPNLYDEPFAETSDRVVPGSNKESKNKTEALETELSESNKASKESNFSRTRRPNTKSISLANLPIADDVSSELQQVTQATNKNAEVTPETETLSKGQIWQVQPGVKTNNGSKPMAYVCKTCESQASTRKSRSSKDFRTFSLGQLPEFDDRSVVSMRCIQCKSPKLSEQHEACHDLMITRPPKKPAPKPPALMKNKSKSLTTLAGKFPVLSEQLDVNGSSSLHKLNDSCSDHLCELLSQTKDVSPTSEGVYVGIIGDQGVILRKRRVHEKHKRVLSMPSELLENVMEVEGTEVTNYSNIKNSTSEVSNEPKFPSAESGIYSSCMSSDPSSSDVFNCRSQKELCTRSVSISSVEVQDFSSKNKIHAQSVPCLAFNKHCLDGLKPLGDQDILEDSGFSSEAFSIPKNCISRKPSSTAQSMMSLNFYEAGEDSDDTSDKVTGKPLMYAEALWDHVTMNEEELCFTAGQAIAVYDVDDPEWWFGLASDQIGWFPAAFVRIPVSGTLLNKYQNSYRRQLKNSDGNKASENGIDVCLSKEEIRTKIIEEIVTTEQDYVQNLKDIVEGYLKQAKKRPDMFNDKLLTTLFSNVESIYCFHLDFLHSIEHQYHLQGSKFGVGEVGAVFVENKKKFELYSEYCNNHPRASSELKHLLQQDKYRYFFEACRMLQEMIKISLDGFLLTPVQKICKYPLQLQELLKYTNPEHIDYDNVQNALKAMREVASSINEKKRKVENIKKIAEWQLAIEEWEGEDVLIKSSQLVHSGEVMKLSKGKTQDVTLFLFDHQLVYCRKDLIKKHSLEYKGRIVLENYKFEKLEDGEVSQIGVAVKNAWRLSSKQSNTSCIFQAKSSEQRDKWIEYFLQERKIVYETTSANSVPLEERVAAMDEAKNAVKSGKQRIKGEKKHGNFNTVSRAIGQLHYGGDLHRRKIDLPPPVSSAMLFQRDQPRSSFSILRNSGVFKKRQPKDRSHPM